MLFRSWEQVPLKNRRLMQDVVDQLLAEKVIAAAASPGGEEGPDTPGVQPVPPNGKDTSMKYRKKPVVIDASQLAEENGGLIVGWINAEGGEANLRGGPGGGSRGGSVLIETLEGVMVATPGDWIIRGVAGEFYPCKPDIFNATYEPA